MSVLNKVLAILHFLGLALGFSASFVNMALAGLVAKATPTEKTVLGRLPPVMSRIGSLGLLLLWITGLILVYTRWGGFAAMPWEFHVKLTAVGLLTITIGYIHRLLAQTRRGDTAAASRLEVAGKMATTLAIIAVVFAVLTFE